MLALMTILALFSTSGAQPEAFGLVPTQAVVTPTGVDGAGGYVTWDMDPSFGWQPAIYDEYVLHALFGEPRRLSPDFRGWAFALESWPEFGVMLVPIGGGRVKPVCWAWGLPFSKARFQARRAARFAYSAWLNALTTLHAEIEEAGAEL